MTNADWTYFGIAVDQVKFAMMLALQNQGTCPFCKRTGLTDRYGSKKKHIAKCARMKKQRQAARERGVQAAH